MFGRKMAFQSDILICITLLAVAVNSQQHCVNFRYFSLEASSTTYYKVVNMMHQLLTVYYYYLNPKQNCRELCCRSSPSLCLCFDLGALALARLRKPCSHYSEHKANQ